LAHATTIGTCQNPPKMLENPQINKVKVKKKVKAGQVLHGQAISEQNTVACIAC